MSTSRSNLLSSNNAKSGLESLLSLYSAAELKTVLSLELGESGECAINKRRVRQNGPVDHVVMIARPFLDAGAQGRIQNGKQNVNRRHPPGRNQGGGDARQPR
jgi:hypothetical protein